MKKLLLFVLLLASIVANAQKGISYQAVILDPATIEIPGSSITGQPLVNGNVWVKFAILSGTTSQFEEVQQTKTDAYGLINLTIGSEASTAFNALTWDVSQKSLQVFVSFNNGASYTKVSDQKLSYSPYSLFAETARKLGGNLEIAGGGTGATTAKGALANLGLGNVDNTSDASKPISAATQSALDLKANAAEVNSALDLKASAAMLAAHMAITVDTNMLATKAALTDLNNFAPINSPSFTGTVSGITKDMVGLDLADNTSDAAKPISTATQTALDLKAPTASVNAALNLKASLVSPALTGVPTVPTAIPGTNSNQIATTAYTTAAIAVATAGATSGVAENSVTSTKIATGAVTDSKITSVSASKVTGLLPVTNGGTGQTTVPGILSTLGFASNNVAIGLVAGTPNQGVNAGTIAIGGGAGRGNQGQASIAIGYVSGDQNQGRGSISIGPNAAQANQASESVAIGYAAGQNNQGTGAIAIGTFAGPNSQAAHSIALNAAGSGSALNTSNAGFYVDPIRNTTATSNVLYYNPTTREVTSGPIPSGTSGTAITLGAISSTSNSNGASITAGVLNLAPANATDGGIVTTGAQTFAGSKTFSSDLLVSGKLGIGTTTPNAESSLDITTALPVILPKMNQTQISAIANPSAAMLQFNTTSKKMQVYKESIASASSIFGNTTLSMGATCLRGSGELWFRPTVSGTITQIELSAFGAGEVASLVVNSNYSGGSPSPTLLGTSNSITAVDGWNTWTFATPVTVVANTTYFITSTDANRCLGVRWSNTGDDTTTGNVRSMGPGPASLSSYDPASRITVSVPATNGWVNLKDDVAITNLSSDVTNILPLANGGTGSSTKNFVDLSSSQTVTGAKSFSGTMVVGATSATGTSAALEVKSTTQGLLLPRLTTTQRDAISAPLAAGLLIYNSTAGKVQAYAEAEGTAATLSHSGPTPAGLGVVFDNNICLTFTPTGNWRVTTFLLNVQSIATAGNVTISLYSGIPGSGTLLGSETVATSTLSGGLLTFNFSTPVTVPLGSAFWQLSTDNTAFIFVPRLGTFNDGVNQSLSGITNNNVVLSTLSSYSVPFSMSYAPLIGSWINLH